LFGFLHFFFLEKFCFRSTVFRVRRRDVKPLVLRLALTPFQPATTFATMRLQASGRLAILGTLWCALLMTGCDSDHAAPSSFAAVDWFAPTQMRIHPIFTQVADWTHGGKPDGIEAQLEFTDQFDDPTKASGQVLFELFEYRKDVPDSRGKRLAYWVGSLSSIDEQRARWNTTLRTYRFQLVDPSVHLDQSYVLTATFERTGGGRFPPSSIVLPGHVTKDRKRESIQQELNGGASSPTSQPDSTQP
jgi:hypothetical protein